MRHNEKDIKNNNIEKNGDVEMPKGDSRIRNIILIVVGVALFLLLLNFSVIDKLDEIRNWLSENFQYLIEIIIGIVLLFFGSVSVMRYRRFDKELGSIAIIIIGVLFIAFGLVGLGLIHP